MIQLELKEIFKFFFDFFKFYKTVFSSNVSKWKMADLENALKWCCYVEEIYRSIENRKFLPIFLEHLRILFTHWQLNENGQTNLITFLKNTSNCLKNVKKVDFLSLFQVFSFT
jgi:hypothetical protein